MKQQVKRPYFLWDYDLTDAQVREILHGNNETERRWLMSRILASAAYQDVWHYLTLADIVKEFPYLKMRPQIKEMWGRALRVWGYHV